MVPDAPDEGTDPTLLEDALARARAMAPIVEGEAQASEAAGTLTPKVVEAFRDCGCLLYTSPSPRDKRQSRMPSSA